MSTFQTNHYYEFYNGSSGKYVNLNGDHEDNIVVNGEKVGLYTRTNNPDQRWALEKYGNGYRIVLQRGGGYYALNYNISNADCIVWHLDSADDDDTVITVDSVISFGGVYYLRLPKHKAYLTAVGSQLKWMPFTGSADQRFMFLEPGTTPGGTTECEIPGLSKWNYNQKDGPSAGFRLQGCACTCGMDVASFYSGKSYSFADFRNCYEDHSNENPPYVKYLWKTPAGYTFVADNAPSGKNEADTIAYIKRYIDQGIPPICHCLPVTGNQHWVVPFKYTSGSGWDSIWVLDPYLGVERTMAEAMRLSCGGTSGGVDRIMHHPSYSLT